MHAPRNTFQVAGTLYQDLNETLNTVIHPVYPDTIKLLPQGYTHSQALPNCPDPALTYNGVCKAARRWQFN